MDAIYKLKKETVRRRYSPWTIKSYCHYASEFLKFSGKEENKLTKKDVFNYLDYLSEKGKFESTMNIALSAIKFLIRNILKKNWVMDIKYLRKPKRMPVYLTQSEVKILLQSINNKKHWMIVALMYSAGLRLSELVNLKVRDLEIEFGYGWVRNGKGKKDRIFLISEKLKPDLKKMIDGSDGQSNVITTQNSKISRSSIYHIVRKYVKIAGIKKNVHPHTLRHSFATHLIENHASIESVQNLLGHNRLDTTMIYVHAVLPRIHVTSPLDMIS
ncbi:MAG: tyrosine-type recombinase/integrase [Nanoarchaeota archaeon]|nr:tyrosine-type recombinase/integrase [Nanoarchaeota archaeon]